jgi:hypothetical protein
MHLSRFRGAGKLPVSRFPRVPVAIIRSEGLEKSHSGFREATLHIFFSPLALLVIINRVRICYIVDVFETLLGFAAYFGKSVK